MKKHTTAADLPTTEQIARERSRLRYKRRYGRTLRSTAAILLVVAALAVLVATLWMPVLRIYGSSMAPTLSDGQLVVAIKTETFAPGDITAFYYGNKLLIKRYIAGHAPYHRAQDRARQPSGAGQSRLRAAGHVQGRVLHRVVRPLRAHRRKKAPPGDLPRPAVDEF